MPKLNQSQLILPSTINAQTIKDSTGKCWILQGLQDNSAGLSEVDDITIIENTPCCEGCDINILEILELGDFFDEDDIEDLLS